MRPRLSYANVTATLALGIAVAGGTAWAAGSIGARDIKPDAVRSKHIKDGEVAGAEVRDQSLTGADVATGGVLGADVLDDSLTGLDVNEASLLGDLNVLDHRIESLANVCNPVVGGGSINCADATVDVANSAVLAIATVEWSADAGGAAGECALDAAGQRIASAQLGETESTTDSTHRNSTTLVGFALRREGQVTLLCSESESNLRIHHPTVALVVDKSLGR